MAAQVGLCLAGLETPKDTFCRVVAQINLQLEAKVNKETGKIYIERILLNDWFYNKIIDLIL